MKNFITLVAVMVVVSVPAHAKETHAEKVTRLQKDENNVRTVEAQDYRWQGAMLTVGREMRIHYPESSSFYTRLKNYPFRTGAPRAEADVGIAKLAQKSDDYKDVMSCGLELEPSSPLVQTTSDKFVNAGETLKIKKAAIHAEGGVLSVRLYIDKPELTQFSILCRLPLVKFQEGKSRPLGYFIYSTPDRIAVALKGKLVQGAKNPKDPAEIQLDATPTSSVEQPL